MTLSNSKLNDYRASEELKTLLLPQFSYIQ